MDYVALGKRIRKIRLEQQMTQETLASQLGLSTSFIGHIERGSRVMSLETFYTLCCALHTSPSALLAYTDTADSFSLPLDEAEKELLHKLMLCGAQLIKNS